MASVLSEMKALLTEGTEMVEWEDAIGELLSFCEERGIELESEDPDDLIDELDSWIENSDLEEDDIEQLKEFAAGLKKLARGAAKVAGKVAGTAHRAADKYRAAKAGVKKFGGALKKAYKSGEKSAHHPKPNKKPRAKGKGARRTIKRPAKKPMNRPKGMKR
jgi:hypothetical protein